MFPRLQRVATSLLQGAESDFSLLLPAPGECTHSPAANGKAEDIEAALLFQKFHDFWCSIVPVAAHRYGNMRPVPADTPDHVTQNHRSLCTGRPLARA